MTPRKIAANRSNSQWSSGPRTDRGKLRASRNSRKHGLAAMNCRQAAAADVERLAKVLCGDHQNPSLLAQARLIAEGDLVLRVIRAHKLAVVERLCDPNAAPLASGDNSMAWATARVEEGKLAQEEIDRRIPGVLEKYKDQLPPVDELIQLCSTEEIMAILMDLLEPPVDSIEDSQPNDTFEDQATNPERDEYEALEKAAPDLESVERYERRAWSRQLRAIRDFMTMERL